MSRRVSDPAPDAASVLRFFATRMRNSKVLVGAAVLAAIVVAAVLYGGTARQVWTGRGVVTIGIAPPKAFILQQSGPPLAPLETPRAAATRMSDPAFKDKVIKRAAFAPGTAAVSREMVRASLRAFPLEADREVAVEVTAGSAGDVSAALGALREEITQAHQELLNLTLPPLRARIEEEKARLALLEASNDELNTRILSLAAKDKNTVVAPTPTPALAAWSQLKDRIQLDQNLAELTEPTVVRLETSPYPSASRTIATLKASALAGLLMLGAVILLALALGWREGSRA